MTFQLCRQDITSSQVCKTRSTMMTIAQNYPLNLRNSLSRGSCSTSHLCSTLVTPSRPRSRRRVAACSSLALSSPLAAISMAYSSDPAFGSAAGFSPLNTALPTALAAILAFGLARFLQANQQNEESALPECPKCEGTGFEPCPICTRWSDGDIGCSCCRGSGRAVCSSCGGGGKAQPVLQPVRKGDS